MKTTLFGRSDVAEIVSHVGLDALMDEAIDGIRRACRALEQGQFSIPLRSGFDYDRPHTGLLEWMPAMRMGEKIVVKMVGYHPDNPERLGVPTILSTILVFDPASGHLASVIDGTFLTALRTGAASAVATQCLMREDSQTLGLIGAGAQAVTQLHALSRVMSLGEVRVYDTDAATLNSFSRRTAALGLPQLPIRAGSLAEASACDVVCTATSVAVGGGPVLHERDLTDGVHINAVGSDFPGKTELPAALVRRALVCPDFAAQALLEGESQVLGERDLGPDLATLVRDSAGNDARRSQTTVFDSTGWALEDYVVAERLTHHGLATGAGQVVELESLSADPKDPYGFLQPVAVQRQRGAG